MPDNPERPRELSVLELLNVLLRNRRLLVLIPVVLALVTVVVTLVLPRTYTTGAEFMPEAAENMRSLTSSLAAQFGINLPTLDQGATSPRFYADLVGSRLILGALVDSTYSNPEAPGDRQHRLSELLHAHAGDSFRLREATIRRLNRDIETSTDPQTGVVTVSVTTRQAWLSRELVARILALLNHFNLETRQSQARAEREFVQGRLAAARVEEQHAEDTLRAFLDRNRLWQNAPDLVLAHDRLQREVDLRYQVTTSLAQAFEQARMDEVRDTPVITVIERPELRRVPDPRHLVLKGVAALVAGELLAVFAAFAAEFFRRSQRDLPGSQLEEFGKLRRDLLSELRRPWRLITR